MGEDTFRPVCPLGSTVGSVGTGTTAACCLDLLAARSVSRHRMGCGCEDVERHFLVICCPLDKTDTWRVSMEAEVVELLHAR